MSGPNDLRGRVVSLCAITLIGLPALGALGSSAVAEWLDGAAGAPRAILSGAVVLGVILLQASLFFWQRATSAPRA